VVPNPSGYLMKHIVILIFVIQKVDVLKTFFVEKVEREWKEEERKKIDCKKIYIPLL
jgi:ribosome biogenesis GTPase A